MKSPSCDPQREEVYKWEKRFKTQFYDLEMRPRAMHKLAREMGEVYGTPKPKMVKKKLGKHSYTGAAWGDHTIEVNTDRAEFTPMLVAHEMAHIVCYSAGIDEPDHGPTWLGVYLWLLDRFKIVPKCASLPSARKAGLKFKKLEAVQPGAI